MAWNKWKTSAFYDTMQVKYLAQNNNDEKWEVMVDYLPDCHAAVSPAQRFLAHCVTAFHIH